MSSEKNETDLNWKVAGLAGEGIMTTGLLFSKTCARSGYYVFDYTEYPSLIRGGHNTYQVYADVNQVGAQRKEVDVLVALTQNALNFHKEELSDNSLVIYDKEDDKTKIEEFGLPGKTFDLPMVRLATEAGADRLMGNNVGLGASVYFLGLDLEVLNKLIADIFGRKGEEVVKMNQDAAKAGYDYAKSKEKPLRKPVERTEHEVMTLTGNEAVGLGAIAGGLQMYVAYPMTPSSSVLHYLAKKSDKANIVVKHAEDEIGAVNMALGASFAGVRSMVGTSGGGFAYMTEALGLSGVAELPLVVFVAMRPGPALGMPTWTAQGDVHFAINASQDEFPRFVLAPGDAKEAFELSSKANELAEKYQTLVLLLSDKYLSESRYTMKLDSEVFKHQRYGFVSTPTLDESGFYPRFTPTESGVSERSIPGMVGGTYIANSYEHDNYGLAIEEGSIRKERVENRARKWESMRKEVPKQLYEYEEKAKVTLISFGSTKGPVVDARKILKSQGLVTNMLNISWLWPFPKEQVKKVILESEDVIVIEGNSTGQLTKLITQETGMILKNNYRRYDGRPFYVEEIIELVKGKYGQ